MRSSSEPWQLPASEPPQHHDGDFVSLIKSRGLIPSATTVAPASRASNQLVQTHGTTIPAIKYKDGVLVAGDRRATAGNLIMYDRADKVLPLDKYSVLAISGAPGVATEMS